MKFGLTQRELHELTQPNNPEVLKHGEIEKVLEILVKDYQYRTEQRIQQLAGLERDRLQKIENESGLTLVRVKTEKKPKRRDEKQAKKSLQHVEWMDTQKPGWLPSPSIRKNKGENECETSEQVRQQSLDSADGDNQSTEPEQTDMDAYLHLPMGLVRNPCDMMQEFLRTEEYVPLYQRGNALVILEEDRIMNNTPKQT